MKNISTSYRLFAKPSFIEGVSRLLDLGATLQRYNDSVDENQADSQALKSDWKAIGNDLKSSIRTYEQRIAKVA